MSAVSACPACAAAPLAQAVAQTTARPAADTTLSLSLPGLHCAACIAKVERAVMALPNVTSARVNLSLKRVVITAQDIAPEIYVSALARAGYEAHPLDGEILHSGQDVAGRALLSRLAIAGFAMMNVMLLSVAIWSGATDATRDLFHMISAAIALPVVAYAGQPFFASALRALRAGGLNMDVPISLAIALASGMSLYETFHGGTHAYFDAALSLTFFLLIGRYLDHRSRAAARSAAKELSALEVQTAYRLTGTQVTKVALRDLAIGDVVQVPTGTRVPVDGTLQSPQATTDRSFLTGESDAMIHPRGAPIQAGEINLGGAIRLRATAVGENTTLRRVAGLVEMAEASRNSYSALADRAARIYAPLVHLLALVAFVVWVALTGELRFALNVAIAVLIITCPCALGLAVPAVATAAIGRLYAMGILVKSGTALERLAEVDTIVFDKTGTLTLPGLNMDQSALTPQAASVAKALAQSSDHPVSRAIAEALTEIDAAMITDAREVCGQGVQATWQGQSVRLGKSDWLGGTGPTTGVRIGTAPVIPLPLSDRLRPGACEAVAALRAAGFQVQMISGDRADAVTRAADRMAFDVVRSDMTAEEKHSHLSALAEQGHKVLMVGDGLNDTAALAAAHASLAPSSALDASRNAADMVLLRDGLEPLPHLMKIAAKSTALSRGNFAIAAGYNLIAVPVACLGLATPLLAALAMSASSITVLLNALRVRRVS